MSIVANAPAKHALAMRNEAIRQALSLPDGQRPTLKALALEHGLSVERVRQIGDRIKQIGPDISRLTARDGSRMLIESKFDGGYDVYLQPARKPRTFLGTISGIRQRWLAFVEGKQIADPQRNLACACEEILAVHRSIHDVVKQESVAADVAVEITAVAPTEQVQTVAAEAPTQAPAEPAAALPDELQARIQSVENSSHDNAAVAANDPEWINVLDFASFAGRKAKVRRSYRHSTRPLYRNPWSALPQPGSLTGFFWPREVSGRAATAYSQDSMFEHVGRLRSQPDTSGVDDP